MFNVGSWVDDHGRNARRNYSNIRFRASCDGSTARTRPGIFALIIHTGINAAGKTIVHPLDGFARIPGSAVRYAAAEITTTALRKLASKWLAESDRDFASLSDEAGDLVKAAREAARLRQTTPSAGFRVALVTNHEPSDDLQKAVDTYALRHRLEYTIVSRGALANDLDNTANGNYHRARLFRTLQTRLSWDLLHDIADESWRCSQPSCNKPKT